MCKTDHFGAFNSDNIDEERTFTFPFPFPFFPLINMFAVAGRTEKDQFFVSIFEWTDLYPYIYIGTGGIPGRKGSKIYYPSDLYFNSAFEADIYKNVPDKLE